MAAARAWARRLYGDHVVALVNSLDAATPATEAEAMDAMRAAFDKLGDPLNVPGLRERATRLRVVK